MSGSHLGSRRPAGSRRAPSPPRRAARLVAVVAVLAVVAVVAYVALRGWPGGDGDPASLPDVPTDAATDAAGSAVDDAADEAFCVAAGEWDAGFAALDVDTLSLDELSDVADGLDTVIATASAPLAGQLRRTRSTISDTVRALTRAGVATDRPIERAVRSADPGALADLGPVLRDFAGLGDEVADLADGVAAVCE